MNIDDYSTRMTDEGWAIIPGMVGANLLAELILDLMEAYERCRSVQKKNGVDVMTDGTVHHLLGQAPSFLRLFEEVDIEPYVGRFFNSKFIVNTYGGVINLPQAPSYVCNVHRDLRTFSGPSPTMLNLLVMLDDFTLDNGATYLLPRGHKSPEKPDDGDFFARAVRAEGKAGSLLFFNSNLWHAAGPNRTKVSRRALTIAFTKPSLKQQLDYPRALGYDLCESLPDKLKQIVGYNARMPTNLDEWYQPPAKRFYKADQG